MPRWVLPATILFLIGVAFVFRWEYGPVQYYGLKTAVYKHDRWTGQDWVKIYESSYEGTKIRENPVPYDRDARKNRETATKIGALAAFITFIWLVLAVQASVYSTRSEKRNAI
ncbi:hypothetical protein [Syntrophothermus lipocalidus]|uniref:Uncharacterized protein n=1 Tax=Syntrophothermus lipocalidus (strain DSM 12680 / TGB-C1) TaxID=643648 RepID=D7CNT8_SYNLT|nr:hypothetical protein [Syntrophothermus lipocalidus]ADI02373.1 hypothetical protein Slip_1612 [Syntrophothermus lipocalidus DSM 12680]